ncbi:MAG: TatD family hydrolase [Gammaproteobacteria bacterium]|nr:TatD family hydrolase [Gammaproteobacteria bacterium]
MLVDSHCHLNMIDTEPDILLEAAGRLGVEYFLNVSVDLNSFPAVLEVARRFDNVFASTGTHPNSSREAEASVEDITRAAADPKVVAIGETGLDYFRSKGDLEWQRQRFRRHIRAAREISKPLIIHCREAAEDTLRILQEENAAETGGVMHCFAGDWDMAQQVMDMGFYISFSGIVTFKNAIEIKGVAKQIPPSRMLIETDAPFLAPVPYRGKRCQPAYVRYVAEHIAELREESVEAVGKAVSENFFKLFGRNFGK